MASKLILLSESLLNLLLLLTIAATDVASVGTQVLKIHNNNGTHGKANVGAPARRFSVPAYLALLPKGAPVPPGGPSLRHNGLHESVGSPHNVAIKKHSRKIMV